MKKIFAATALIAAVAVAGCQSTGPRQGFGTAAGAVAGGILGNQIGAGEGRVVATVLGAAIGGLIGSEVGRALDEQDRQRMYAAHIQALDSGRAGAPVQWSNPNSGRAGQVVPGQPYQINQLVCRDYTHTVYIDGQPELLTGTACRQPDGTWREA